MKDFSLPVLGSPVLHMPFLCCCIQAYFLLLCVSLSVFCSTKAALVCACFETLHFFQNFKALQGTAVLVGIYLLTRLEIHHSVLYWLLGFLIEIWCYSEVSAFVDELIFWTYGSILSLSTLCLGAGMGSRVWTRQDCGGTPQHPVLVPLCGHWVCVPCVPPPHVHWGLLGGSESFVVCSGKVKGTW